MGRHRSTHMLPLLHLVGHAFLGGGEVGWTLGEKEGSKETIDIDDSSHRRLKTRSRVLELLMRCQMLCLVGPFFNCFCSNTSKSRPVKLWATEVHQKIYMSERCFWIQVQKKTSGSRSPYPL